MKRLVLLVISVSLGVIAYADGIEYFEHVKLLYQQGRYEEAKQGFVSCKTYYSDELNVSSINEWISLCQSKINERNAAIQARRQAETAEATRKAYEAKQQERIEKKLLYVSSNAFIFNKEYTGMHQAIKGYLSDAGFKFTDDIESAYWSVFITANAYEFNYVKEEQTGYSVVNACVKVTNEITKEIIYENELLGNPCGFPDLSGDVKVAYQRAAVNAYKKINQKLGELIVKTINR